MAKTNHWGAIAAAAGTSVAVGLVLLIMVVVEARPAEATFPGKNGKIAFVREGALDTHIFTINPDGSGLAKISTRPFFDSSPAWSPDGKKIAFSGITYSGRTFPGLLRGNYDIYVVNADGSNLKRITESRAIDSSPSWSPDGKKIAFVRQRGQTGLNTVCRQSCIYKIRVDGTGLKRLTGTKRFATDPAWSPNGKKIAFSQVVRRPGLVEIFTMNATDGSQKTNLTNTPLQESEPDWSPDGKKIAYTSFTQAHGAHDRVFTMNADGSDQTNLTKLKDGSSPAWSPNSKKIAFIRAYPPFPNLDIFVMKAGGTEVKRLTKTEAFDRYPDWQSLP